MQATVAGSRMLRRRASKTGVENVSLRPIRQSLRMLLSVQDADRQPRPRENPK